MPWDALEFSMVSPKLMLGIGLMSGTSGDGVDVAIVRFDGGKIALLATGFLPYPAILRKEIMQASQPDGEAQLICRLNVELGKVFAAAAMLTAKKAGISMDEIRFIGSHGQTIRHQPVSGKGKISSTLQIGEAAEIAHMCGCLVVSDFRPADIAAGGCGAPLAPLAHHAMFADEKQDRIVHNLGGISNITWLPAGCGQEKVAGFDTGPANMLIDLAVSHFSKGKAAFDKGGKTAMEGKVDKRMFGYCMAHPYYSEKPPKSTGRETFGADYFGEILKRHKKVGKEDFLRTLCAVTAGSAVSQAVRFLKPQKKFRWVLCGGGAYNNAIVAEIGARLEGRGAVSLSGELGFGEKSVEPVLMAVLAHRTLHGLPGNLPQVTGAKMPMILGKISLP